MKIHIRSTKVQGIDELIGEYKALRDKVIHDLNLYKLLFGEIRDPYGEVDTELALKNYDERKSFNENFGRYMEELKNRLG